MFRFWSGEILRWLCVASAVLLTLAENVFLTDASSYLPRADVFLKKKEKEKKKNHERVKVGLTPLEHMLLVLSPSTMTEPRPASVRSSLIADEVKGHKWAGMDFPQLYTEVCTNTQQNNHSDIDFRRDGVIS